jgi:hypothetical protein
MNQAESPTPTSDRTAPEPHIRAQPDGTTSLDFDAIREQHPATWNAALDANPTVTDAARADLFVVDTGEGRPANCSLARTPDGTYCGWCSCPAFDATGICPHLCVLRQRASLNMLTLPHRQE